MRHSKAKRTGSFRVYSPATRHVGAHADTLAEARKDAAYFVAAGAKMIEIQERLPSGKWVVVELVERFKL